MSTSGCAVSGCTAPTPVDKTYCRWHACDDLGERQAGNAKLRTALAHASDARTLLAPLDRVVRRRQKAARGR